MDIFEQAAFGYEVRPSLDAEAIEKDQISGQELLVRIKNLLEECQRNGMVGQFEKLSFMKEGKFAITSHKNKFDGSMNTGCRTAFTLTANNPYIPLPVGIILGEDYLKRVLVLGADGKERPVFVDSVVAHEIAHMAYRTDNEAKPCFVENVVTMVMGGKQRANNSKIRTGQDHGYKILYPNVQLEA